MSALGAAYDAFLFAAIPDDGAAPLNTVSVLARLDIDPWREAAELTSLPRESAVQRLVTLLVRMPGRSIGLLDAEMIAMRLVALLPARNSVQSAVTARTSVPARAFDPTMVVIGLGFALVVLVSGFFQAADIQTAEKTAGKPSSASNAHPATASQPDTRR
jgi:hypothetical protein